MTFTITNVSIGPYSNNAVALRGEKKDDKFPVEIVNNQLVYKPNMSLPRVFDGNLVKNNGNEEHELHCKATHVGNGEYIVCVTQGTVSTEIK